MEKLEIIKKILKLPKLNISFKDGSLESTPTYKRVFTLFTKRHRTLIFKNKTQGVALIDLTKFKDFEDYLSSVNGKNSPAYYRRKALKKGYSFKEINKSDYIDDIDDINQSMTIRQGKEMSDKYKNKQTSFLNEPAFRYFGIFDINNKLVSYCDIGFFGEFSLIAVLLGHKNNLNDGIMNFMILEVIKATFDSHRNYNYVMYDMFFGATAGLQKFKKKLGFTPYKVNWKWEK